MDASFFYQYQPVFRKELKVLFRNKDLRLNVYKYMLDSLIERRNLFYTASLCMCVPSFVKFVKDDNLSTRLEVLPELWKHKPKISRGDEYWFDETDFETRINILKEIINNMSK